MFLCITIYIQKVTVTKLFGKFIALSIVKEYIFAQ